jgi:hypothetical protein
MKVLLNVVFIFSGLFVSTCCAAPFAGRSGSGFLVWMFVGFIALFIVSQIIPSLVLCFSLLKGLLYKKESTLPVNHD